MPYSHGVRFEPEVPFGNPRYSFNIHSARLAARATSWERSCPVLHHPGLEAGRRKTRHVTVSLLVVFKTIRLSKIQGLALKTGRKEGNHCGRKANSAIRRTVETRRVVGLTYEYLARRLK